MVFSLETQTLIVPKSDKEEYGEIATPYCVIEDMLNVLPSELFENPDLKWFDPCCGKGYFMEMIYNRLFYGLRECFTDEVERRDHIMHNMLYMMDIQVKFKDELKRKGFMNVWTQDMFQCSFSFSFDVIVANPPYTIGGKMKVPTLQGMEKTKDGKAIWMKCIYHLMRNLLKENGIGLFITPVLWLRPDRYGYHASFFSEFSVDKLCVFNCSESFRLFAGHAQTPVCFYTLRNYTIGMNRHLISIYDSLHRKYILWNTFRYGHVIPMCIPSIVKKIMNKITSLGKIRMNCDNYMLSSIVHKSNMPSKYVQLSNVKGVDENVHGEEVDYMYANVKTCTFGVAPPDDAFTVEVEGGVASGVAPPDDAFTGGVGGGVASGVEGGVASEVASGVAPPDDAFTGGVGGGVASGVEGGVASEVVSGIDGGKACPKGLPYRETALVINYSDRPCAFYGRPKMILAHKMYGMPYLDLCGEYGISNRDNYVLCMDDVFDISTCNVYHDDGIDVLEEYMYDGMYALKKWMKSPLVFAIMDTTRYRMRYLEKWAFHFIPNILKVRERDKEFPDIMCDDFHMDDIYKYFGFDEKECNYIKQFG